MNLRTIYIESLGCPKNQVESEKILGCIPRSLIITNDPSDADIIIINTCSFIDPARRENIQYILEYASLKNNGRLKQLIICGCFVQSHGSELMQELTEVDYFSDADEPYKDVYNYLLEITESKELDKKAKYSIPNPVLLGHPGIAYLKVAEGCNRKCAFCTIPGFKGKYRSFMPGQIVHQAEVLAGMGVKELNIIAQETSDYGKDLVPKSSLSSLLEKIAEIEGIEWIRVLYAYPTTITDELISAVKNISKVVPYIDMPVQHTQDRILKLMKRGMSRDFIFSLIEKLRSKIPDIAIRTTIITGFPSETEKEFLGLLDDIKQLRFDHLGAFSYSDEPDAASSLIEEKIPPKVAIKRKKQIMRLQKEISADNIKKYIGKEFPAIVEEMVENPEGSRLKNRFYIARLPFQAPDIDGNVIISTRKKLAAGSIYNIKIKKSMEYDLYAGLVNHNSRKI